MRTVSVLLIFAVVMLCVALIAYGIATGNRPLVIHLTDG